tara:strand:- start:153 stop:272 length:120 start_codon:yes stop_codon:yes gene_type:complete
MLLSEKNTLAKAYKEKDKCYKDLERVEEAMGVDLPIRFA